jgi:hypothetical protein
MREIGTETVRAKAEPFLDESSLLILVFIVFTPCKDAENMQNSNDLAGRGGLKFNFQKPSKSRLTRDHLTGIFRPSLAANRLTPMNLASSGCPQAASLDAERCSKLRN